MQVVVDNLLANYQKSGQGKVLVCLHGWGDSAQTFSKLEEELQGSYTLLALDLPGFGSSQPPPVAWGLGDYAQFVASWLEKIGIKGVQAIIGHSNGGAIAIVGLASGVLKADELILLASSGVRDQQMIRKRLLKMVAKTSKVATAPLPAATRRKLQKRFYRAVGSEIFLLPHLEETFRRIVVDIQKNARELQLPTLILYGSNDKETPPSYGRLLANAIKGSKFIILPDVGHFIHQEQPNRIAHLIETFLDDKNE